MKRLAFAASLLTVSSFALVSLILGNVKSKDRSNISNVSLSKSSSLNREVVEGKEIFNRYCIACHGADGKGNGPEAYRLETKPTDFTSGNIKFKSTPYGTLPLENDIVTTLRLGVRTTAMLPQLQLSDEQMHAVAAYVMSFMPKDQGIGIPIEMAKAPPVSNSLLETGKKLFETDCAVCHGKGGEGDGPASKNLTDYLGRPIRPANLTVRPLKRANTPRRMYLIISTGLEGTPMPTFRQALTPKDRWAVVDYVESLKRGYFSAGNNNMMGGMMKHRLVGEESKGMMIDMAAGRAWMMGGMMRGSVMGLDERRNGFMMDGMGWGGMWFFWLIVLGVIVWAIVSIVNHSKNRERQISVQGSALDILRKRYARGEISKEQFEQMKKDLNS